MVLSKFKETVKRNAKKEEIRKKSPFAVYGITVAQAAIEKVDPEPKFKQMLGKQRDAAAEANIEKQQAKKAEYEKQKIIAVGEKNKAAKRAEMEQIQVEEIISAETAKKKMLIQKEESAIALEKARLEAKAKLVSADAEAYERKALMKADNALSVRLNALIEIARVNADAISKWSSGVPQTVIINGEGSKSNRYSSSDQLLNLITAQYASQLGLNPVDLKAKE